MSKITNKKTSPVVKKSAVKANSFPKEKTAKSADNKSVFTTDSSAIVTNPKKAASANITPKERIEFLHQKHFHKLNIGIEKRITYFLFLAVVAFSTIGIAFIFAVISNVHKENLEGQATNTLDLYGKNFGFYTISGQHNTNPVLSNWYYLLFIFLFLAVSCFIVSHILEYHWKYQIRSYKWSYFIDTPALLLFIVLTIIVILPSNHPKYSYDHANEQLQTFQGMFLKYYSTIGSNGGYVWKYSFSTLYWVCFSVSILFCVSTITLFVLMYYIRRKNTIKALAVANGSNEVKTGSSDTNEDTANKTEKVEPKKVKKEKTNTTKTTLKTKKPIQVSKSHSSHKSA